MGFDTLTDGQAIMESSSSDFKDIMKSAYESRLKAFGSELLCYSPTAYPYKIEEHRQVSRHNFISISVTGTSCALQCDHCEGRLLKGMEPAMTSDQLIQVCKEVRMRGAEGVLISGGSDSRGHVPLSQFGTAIKAATTELGLKVVVHTGLVDDETVQMLKDASIDAAMLDIIGSREVSESIYHLEDGPKRMEQSLELLHAAGIPTVPHVLVGLDYGSLGGEIEALDMISRTNPAGVVIIALSPLRKTPMASAKPPSAESIGKVLTVTRLAMKETPVLLGCARPIGQHKIDTDKYALQSGVNGVAYISQEGVDYAKSLGLKPVFRDVCCSLAYEMIT
ncbi:MAG: radical SAM protein [Candidatus Thorarchaeota archaeon]